MPLLQILIAIFAILVSIIYLAELKDNIVRNFVTSGTITIAMSYFYILMVILILIVIIGIEIPISIYEYMRDKRTIDGLITRILNGEINDSKEILKEYNKIKSEWEERNMINKIKKYISSKTCVVISFIPIIIGIYFLYRAYTILDTDNSTNISISISIGIGLIAIGIALVSLCIARQSDKKMRDIANSNFLGVAGFFEDERYKIRKTNLIVVAIWKSFTHLRQAILLKNWVDDENQEILIARFGEFLDELYAIKQGMDEKICKEIFNVERCKQIKNMYNKISELKVFNQHKQDIIQKLNRLDIEMKKEEM